MKYNFIICHYAEIGLKGKNRKFFEEKLIENLKKALKDLDCREVRRISGRILVKLVDEAKEDKIREALKNVFGIAYFSFALACEQEVKVIKKKAVELLGSKKFKTFRIETKRSKKDFPLTSQEINEKVGAEIVEKLNKKVNLTNPDITCFIEIVENYAFLYLEKIKGQGGLPVGASGKIISLLSGGIDSPVASFYGMRRGVKIIFLHFYTQTQNSIDKTEKIIRTLNKYQFISKLYSVPFLNIQKEIFQKTNPEYGCILCRRFMFRIAEVLAEKEKADALITGENIGQVASQTLANIRATEEATNLPVLRPLIGMDKKDIIDKAKEIGTFDISILAEEFYCHGFLAKHPETKANLKKVKEEEKKLDVEKLIKEAVEKAKVEII
jgi:thiamine biosynthesis protein ThiI